MSISISGALDHIQKEIGHEFITQSLESDLGLIQKAHDAIHEFHLLPVICVPDDDNNKETIWLQKSAFLVLQWELFDCLHRSFFEAMCSYYNVAEMLLRSSLELLVKGAFWECFSHKKYRQIFEMSNKLILGSKDFTLLKNIIREDKRLENDLELNSVAIYDFLAKRIYQKATFNKMVEQLDEWEVFSPLEGQAKIIKSDLYSNLSDSTHVYPNKTDIGRRMQSKEQEVFSREFDKKEIENYLITLHKIIDIAIVVELNIFSDVIQNYPSVQNKLEERIDVLTQLDLRKSLLRLNTIKI